MVSWCIETTTTTPTTKPSLSSLYTGVGPTPSGQYHPENPLFKKIVLG